MSMAGLRLALILTLGLVLGGSVAEEVPVYIWGDLEQTLRPSNPLETTSSADLEAVLQDEINASPPLLLVAFVEGTLSVEDLSAQDDGAPVFPYLLSQLGDSVYLPAVDSALEILQNLADAEHTDRVRLTEKGLVGEMRADSRVLVVDLSDAREDETRAALLRRHNDFMKTTVEGLRAQRGRIVCVYTAHYPSWSVTEDQPSERSRRHLLQAEVPEAASATEPQFYNITGDLLLYLNSITVSEKSGAPVPLTFAEGDASATKNGTDLTITIESSNYTVRLLIRLEEGYWFLDEADVTSKGSGETERIASSTVFALEGFSYHCSSSVEFTGPNVTYSLTLTDFQLQPFFTGEADRFGDAMDCTGFTSIPIWSGLFVVFIMLAIFFYGVSMMMDIRTMDRFDDPKGKTITINANE